MSFDDTIAAIASAPGGAARGIVRLSGGCVVEVVGRVFAAALGDGWTQGRQACVIPGVVLGRIPCDLFLWPTEHSYTRQPTAELHTLGSPPLLEMLLGEVCAAGARLAQPGEFTLRAFLAGRIDLTQAEAVLGVIDANDQRQLDVALAQLAGGLSRPLATLRDSLLDLLADLEAGLDFVEEDIRFVGGLELQNRLAAAADEVAALQSRLDSRGRADNEPRVVLIGWPNVGKSSLFNALVGRPDALVSAAPGTTRDYLSAPLELGEIRCRLIDTAGREPTAADAISLAAGELREQQARQARLRLLCLDSTRGLNDWEFEQISLADSQLVVFTKCDAGPQVAQRGGGLFTSAASGAGLDALKAAICAELTACEPHLEVAVAATAARCRESMRLAAEGLRRAHDLAAGGGGDELIAVELRAALDELGKVVGAIYTEDLLDRVFSRFCIGK